MNEVLGIGSSPNLKSLAESAPGQVVLVLQGGGALGSYQAGVYQALHEAGIATARSLILTSAGMANSTEVIRAAREANPSIRVLARASYLRDLPEMRQAGADTVFTGEGEVALAFVEDLLSRLGATAEQIERERARAHDELFGAVPEALRLSGGRVLMGTSTTCQLRLSVLCSSVPSSFRTCDDVVKRTDP